MKTLKLLFVAALFAGFIFSQNVVSAQATKTTTETVFEDEYKWFCPCVMEFLWAEFTVTTVENKNGAHSIIEGIAVGYADPDYTVPTGNVFEFRQVQKDKNDFTSGWTYQIWLDGKLVSLTHINSMDWLTGMYKNGFWCSPHNK